MEFHLYYPTDAFKIENRKEITNSQEKNLRKSFLRIEDTYIVQNMI